MELPGLKKPNPRIPLRETKVMPLPSPEFWDREMDSSDMETPGEGRISIDATKIMRENIVH